MSLLSKLENLIEAISPEERKSYVDYSKKLKAKLSKEFGFPIRVTVSKSVAPNPYIEVRASNYEKDVIPNEFRLMITDKMGWEPGNKDNVSYGNIRGNSIALNHSHWLKVLGEL